MTPPFQFTSQLPCPDYLSLDMQHLESAVPESLQHSIRGFWYWEMDFGATISPFEAMPDGHAEIIFYFGNSCTLNDSALSSPYIVGLLQRPIFFRSTGYTQIIGIKCLPWAVYDLLDLPSTKGGVQSFTHPIASLQPILENMLKAGQVDEALRRVRDWFLGYESISPPEVNKAGTAMLGAGGRLPVSSVAAAAHASVRTLERKFKESSGRTVKDVSALMRFEQVRDRLWAEPDAQISRLAHEMGYADQSHLNREFKRFSGMTAAAFARRKNDLASDFVAIVLSS